MAKHGPKPGTAEAQHGPRALVAKYGREHMAEVGRKGGLALARRRGLEHMAEIGRKGGSKRSGIDGHYPCGHPRDDANSYITHGTRTLVACLTCKRQRAREYQRLRRSVQENPE